LEIQIQIGIQINILIGQLKGPTDRNQPLKACNALKSAKLLQKLTNLEMRHLNFE